MIIFRRNSACQNNDSGRIIMIKLIAAVAANNVIGKDGTIPWDLPEDRHMFKELTMGSTLIMGRRTYESIGRPLPGRKTIVVTTKGISIPEMYMDLFSVVPTLDEAFEIVGEGDAFLCGGARIYEEGLSRAEILYITKVEMSVEGDTFFPEGFEKDFSLIARQRLSANCSLLTYCRI